MNEIDLFKKLAQEDIEDIIAEYYLNEAENFILTATNRKVLIEEMKTLKMKVALCLYSKRGAEYTSQRSEGGVSLSYKIDEDIIERINSYRLLKAHSYAN